MPGRLLARRTPWIGLGVALVLVAAAFAVPPLTGWQVYARAPRSASDLGAPPLHGVWDPKLFGPGTIPAILVAWVGWRWFARWVVSARWWQLQSVGYVLGLMWLFSLALVDGPEGLSRVLGHSSEYLESARDVGSIGSLLHHYVDRMPIDSPGAWPTQPAGHPPLALLLFVALVRVGLGGSLAAGCVVTVIAALVAPLVLSTVRTLGAEDLARRVAPFLVLTPAAVFMAVSADAVFSAVAAGGLALLARGATAQRLTWVGWSAAAGLVLGAGVMMSYGLPLIGLVCLAVLVTARSWRPLPVAALAALLVVIGFALAGFSWWEAYPVLHDRYWAGVAAVRPAAYWMWGDLALLAISAGPLVYAGIAVLVPRVRGLAGVHHLHHDLRPAWTPAARAVVLLAAAGVLCVVVADVSRMSKAEVERIWLPFMPWITLAVALLPQKWRRWGLLGQLVWALAVQQLFYTSW
ncbi:hypothetical protein [Nocardioides acrostichi]|uniref:Uncharacterized protein n=1 Tax=Nocardioides acrostichi TaxID=2784339 RepID=A0A930V1Q0_9ACTN|nr:hypothetical protein [Nocardioides acrostichi]MBF4162271.1 hypothetical protein [Nocardioides acrostichi]